MNNKISRIVVLVFLFSLFSGCLEQPQQTDKPAVESGEVIEETERIEFPDDWRDAELRDVATGKRFKISDFKGKPILLESFAVWCPTCSKQQREIKKLKESEGDAIVHISLDTDPNEDEAKVREHLNNYGFDWYFAVSPIELTRALIDEVGIAFVNAPGAPVVLICEDQSTRLLERGVKSVDKLKSEVERGC